ncbi:anti-sigma-K factor RskA [Krasilnikovia cinnamomea]|uniref:Regulator of SigK n=1 Tax=Krasilnikovia cinnamomea TaxID=349313 RepID=A0A4Q7ZR90_9ACTN|nr:anti-sigma factor [Krasilnikovia cinnamomea]RZU53657.1 anti-sigma-K factor RskA [Krasilnikovia cinnamomea]
MSTDIHALAGAYALDAVDDIERAAFERHLAGCASCAAEVAGFREATARLAEGTWSVPPPGLRDEVLAAVGRTRQLPPGPARRERGAGAALSRWRRYTVAAAAAGILAAGAGAATWAVQEQRVREQQAVADAARAGAARVQAILAAPDVQIRTSAVRGGGRVVVAASASYNAGVVVLTASTAPAPNQALQLWLIKGATPTNAGVLPPGQAASLRVVDGLVGYDALGVSLEPAGGSTTPTEPILAVVSMA